MVTTLLAAAVAVNAAASPRVALDCVLLNPRREPKPAHIEWTEGRDQRAHISFVLTGDRKVVASRIIRMKDLSAASPGFLRQFYVEGNEEGPLVFRVIKEGVNDWGLEAAPADWSYNSGPLATGRCITTTERTSELIPVLDIKQLPELLFTLRALKVEDWNLPKVEKNCLLVSSNNSLDRSRISISESGAISFIDNNGILFSGNFKDGLTASEFQHAIKYLKTDVMYRNTKLSLSLTYRQGRFWIDGHRIDAAKTSEWFRGVCITEPFPKDMQ